MTVSIPLLSTTPRSFKYRRGRITAGQQAALETLWSSYGLDVRPAPVDPAQVFGRVAPVVLEIGFGMGETTLAMAQSRPEWDIIAVDVHTPGVGALLRELDASGLCNVRVVVGDGIDVLRDMCALQSLDEVRVYFPDPWPKVKHRKRRLFSPDFVALAAARLRPGGVLHSATDWEPYARRMLELVESDPLFTNEHSGYAPRPEWRPVTRFERQGLSHGRLIFDVLARRRPATDLV